MSWFTHYTRPLRKGRAPGGRNHVRRSATRTLCGVEIPAWLQSRTVILDPLTGGQAYPDCKRCVRLSVGGGGAASSVPPELLFGAWPGRRQGAQPGFPSTRGEVRIGA